jgi:hypothetical protein
MEKTLSRRTPLCARRRATLPIPEQKRTKTNGIGTKTNKCERKWNETGTKLERNWNETGTKMERNWNKTEQHSLFVVTHWQTLHSANAQRTARCDKAR